MLDDLDDPRKQALLMGALGLLGGGGGKGFGGFARDVSRAGLLGLQGYNQASMAKDRRAEEEQQRQMRQMQMDQMRQGMDWQKAMSAGYQPGTPGVTPLTPNDDNGNPMPSSPAVPPGFDFSQAMRIDPFKTIQAEQAMRKVEAPISVAPGASLVDPKTFRPVYNNQKPEPLPSGMRMGANGPEWIPGYLEGKGRIAKEGASQVNVKYGGNLASELGKGTAAVITDGRTKAEAARDSILQGHQILGAIDSGPTYTGPGASLKLKAAQIAPMLGFKGDETGIRNTRELIVGLANQTINSRGLLKGQGQITEYEQKTLEKAKAGNIDDMTADEIRALVRVNERASRAQIAAHGKIVGSLAKKPEFAEAIPFFQIEAPEEYAPKKPATQSGLSPAEEQELARLRAQFGKR